MEEYQDYDPTTYTDELVELMEQLNQLQEYSADELKSCQALIAQTSKLNEQIESIFCGVVVAVACLGVLAGLAISSLIKGR